MGIGYALKHFIHPFYPQFIGNGRAADRIKLYDIEPFHPPGVQRHIPLHRIVEIPLLCTSGIFIPAVEVVSYPCGVIGYVIDWSVLLFFARRFTGQCTAVRIKRNRSHGGLYPHRIQCATLCFVIPGRAVTVFVAVLSAAGLLIKPAVENITEILRYGHLIQFLTIGDLHSLLCYRTAVRIESNGIPIGAPHGIERQRLICGINIFKIIHLFATVYFCPAGLCVASAGEQSAAQCKVNIIEFIICHGDTLAVCARKIGDIITGDGKFRNTCRHGIAGLIDVSVFVAPPQRRIRRNAVRTG